MSFFGDVYEQIIDGQSGIVPSGNPFAIVVGTCTKGEVGKKYIIGKSTNLDKLGKGRLTDRINDIFLLAKDDAVIIAIPSAIDTVGTISNVKHEGTGKATITVNGSPKCDASIILEILKSGKLNDANAQLSLDGGVNFLSPFTLPGNGDILIEDTGVTIKLTDIEPFVIGDTYQFNITSGKSNLMSLINAVNIGLNSYTPRLVYAAQDTDKVAWAAMGVNSDSLFAEHRPTYFVTESREKKQSESIADYVNSLVTERTGFAHPYVVVSAGYGKIVQKNGQVLTHNFGGLLVGTIAKARVNQSIGEVKEFPITNASLPDDWSNTYSKMLDDAGYTVMRQYAGLEPLYFSNGRTMASKISDYQFIETVDTTFKAIRLARLAALKNLQGDGDALGLQIIQRDIEANLNLMTTAVKKELAAFTVIIPAGQDVVNNGLVFELELFGIPKVRKIVLYFKYKYANPFED